mgnify:CR=1 FL=1
MSLCLATRCTRIRPLSVLCFSRAKKNGRETWHNPGCGLGVKNPWSSNPGELGSVRRPSCAITNLMARSNLRVALLMRSLMMVLLLFMFLYWSCSYALCSAEPTMFLDTGGLRLQQWSFLRTMSAALRRPRRCAGRSLGTCVAKENGCAPPRRRLR